MAEDVHVHQTPPAGSGGGGAGWVMALLVIVILLGVVWFVFVRGGTDTSTGPDQIEIDVNTPGSPPPSP